MKPNSEYFFNQKYCHVPTNFAERHQKLAFYETYDDRNFMNTHPILELKNERQETILFCEKCDPNN
uniref:Uncharacterized protein n=1 Tax=Romanomermis culicivorax TaxID=13658 RepID=A0A915J2B8_ROMCU